MDPHPKPPARRLVTASRWALAVGRLNAQVARVRQQAALYRRTRRFSEPGWPMAAWSASFLRHWSEELREQCDPDCIIDWASELYPTHGHLRAEDVAQSEWESMFDDNVEEDDPAET